MKLKAVQFVLVVGLFVGLIVRLKDIRAPLADWHSWRQADTAAVAREYVKDGIDLLHPQYQDISSLQSGKDNPHGYRMVEFPIVNALVAWIYTTFSLTKFPIHVVYRFVSIIFSLISAVFLYKIMKKIESPFTGLLAALVFLFIPYNIFYSRTILPEVSMVTLSLIALWLGVRYNETQRWIDALGIGAVCAIAFLVKPVAVFLLVPLIPIFFGRNFKKNWLLVFVIGIIAVLPLVWWRWWIGHYPEGIPASLWLLNGNGIRFKGAFFYWLFADRLGRLILGYWGLFLFGTGLLAAKKNSFTIWLGFGTLAYLVIFATGNVQHDYYQIPIIPVVSILVAYGIQYIRHLANVSWLKRYTLLIIAIIFMEMFGWYHVRSLFAINNPAIVAAGQAIDRIAGKTDFVIAPYLGDTAFLYQTNRRGWPIGGDINTKIDHGAKYYVTTVNDDEEKQLAAKYQVVEQTPQYSIIHLVPSSQK